MANIDMNIFYDLFSIHYKGVNAQLYFIRKEILTTKQRFLSLILLWHLPSLSKITMPNCDILIYSPLELINRESHFWYPPTQY